MSERTRSRSPRAADNDAARHRSRSPRDRDDRPRKRDGGRGGSSGFRWKEKRRGNDEPEAARGLERGYRRRSRSPRREREKERGHENSGKSVEDKFGATAKFGASASLKNERHDREIVDKVGEDSARNKSQLKGNAISNGTDKPQKGNSVEDKFGVAAKFGPSANTNTESKREAEKEDGPPERAAAQSSSGGYEEPMIIVHVNDRLGTKAAIPCLASDPIKLFKAQVAARIGRQPHEILLKRQGERPFKDQLTLEDYGVSNGVQIDLEIDTGE